MKKKNFYPILFGIFGIVGVILIVSSILVFAAGKKFDETAVEITGTISYIDSYWDSDGDRHYQVYVDYDFQGHEFTDIRLGTYTSSMYEGKEITLKVDPENPGKVKTPHSYMIAGIILAVLGVIFALIGIISAVIGIKKSAKKKELLQQGRYICAVVERVDMNYNYYVNGRHPYVIYCNYQDEYSGVLYRFKSDNMWTDPYPFLQQGSNVRVYVDGQDYSKYYVDVEGSLQGKVVDYT
ncbi:MAG: DUF3592 domain-containing protein [Lachnospiraceae bacterium]|nr:DUF3592 domain-containing protein [Lachnospiraceae bacterium]